MKQLVFSTILAGVLLTSCSGVSSKKGDWSKSDKEKAHKAIAEIDKELSDHYGDQKQDFIDCYLEKVENNYEDFATANADVDGCTKLAEQCSTEISGL
ncbi:hypothetical protein [Parvicella tangerina]|uniref:Lipoprotein n=1 Tax=Parvicella tangerina TaxID=2829795 RepID=A0A916JNK6_9FLAO|nr:hypothetical protein [Parvicella tangerina]CAG5081079.1 hypothetical protein CRYO30217_01531 [Parvicella tangerina]